MVVILGFGYRHGRSCPAGVAIRSPFKITVAATVAKCTLRPHCVLVNLLDFLSYSEVTPELGVCTHSLDLGVFHYVNGTTAHFQETQLQHGLFRIHAFPS